MDNDLLTDWLAVKNGGLSEDRALALIDEIQGLRDAEREREEQRGRLDELKEAIRGAIDGLDGVVTDLRAA